MKRLIKRFIHWLCAKFCIKPKPAPVKDCLNDWTHTLQVERGCNRCIYTMSCLTRRNERA